VRLVLLVALVGGSVFAQEFPPSPPPLTQAPEGPEVAAEVAPDAGVPAPKPARWSRVTASASGVVSGWSSWSAGVEVGLGAQLGTPSAGERPREVEGLVVAPLLELSGARLAGALCGGPGFCGDRWTLGAGLRLGHARGLHQDDGSVWVRRHFFGELSVHGVYVNVPPAPLVGRQRWFEAALRARAGALVNTAALTGKSVGFVIHVSAFFEWLAFQPRTTGPQIGFALGVAL
jgi:hypothetical protein